MPPHPPSFAASLDFGPQSLHLLQAIVDHIQDGVIITEAAPVTLPGPRIVYVNPAMLRETGFSREEVIGQTPLMFRGRKQTGLAPDHVQRQLQSAGSVALEMLNYRKDGSAYWTEVSISPLKDAEGHTTHWIAIQRNIHDRKLVEQQLQRSKALLDETGAIAQVGGWEFDVVTRAVTWTRETYHIHEVHPPVPPTEAQAVQFFHPHDRPRFLQAVRETIVTGKPFDHEFRFITARGNHLWVNVRCSAVRENGRTTRIQGTFQDITKQKETAARLAESEERLRLALEAGQMGTYDWDIPANRIHWSEQHYLIFGTHRNQMPMVQFQHFMECVHPEDRAELERKIHRAMKAHLPYTHEYRVKQPSGKVRWMASYGDFQYQPDGSPSHMMGVVHDISERKQAEHRYRNTWNAFASGPAIMVRWSTEHPYYMLAVSDSIRHWGYDPADFLNRKLSFMDIVHPDDREPVISEIHAVQQKKVYNVVLKYRIRTKDGQTRQVYDNSIQIYDELENMLHADGYMLDVSEAGHFFSG